MNSRRSRKNGIVACIFVHAGAGYHSQQNEHIHLSACNDAAKAAMLILKNNGSAVDAVEIAIKILEDREITNAGYGSNLTMDGVVECDAVVVDKFGRSGAVGAVAQIKNPISLARLILDHTAQSLSLRRVPPNLLVGQGATDFAHVHGMPVLPLSYMISPSARERWRRWQQDLFRAEQNDVMTNFERSIAAQLSTEYDLEQQGGVQEREDLRRLHTKAMQAGVWNEGQPMSPPPTHGGLGTGPSPPSSPPSSRTSSHGPPQRDDHILHHPNLPPSSSEPLVPNSPLNAFHGMIANRRIDGDDLANVFGDHRRISNVLDEVEMENQGSHNVSPGLSNRAKSWAGPVEIMSSQMETPSTHAGNDYMQTIRPHTDVIDLVSELTAEPQPDAESRRESSGGRGPSQFIRDRGYLEGNDDQDIIIDTVGAIAIDLEGNIACGASSGGIGMKHRGRVGPAALVGTGAAVVPATAEDPDGVTVATVTSGTGEHMATTQAASVCGGRVYHNVRQTTSGQQETCIEDEAIKGFIEHDFMAHPSVQNSISSGAIGMLSVKKTNAGVYLYFAHNTDSFALASMHAAESRPICTMSRSKGNGSIAQGGRSVRFRKRRA